MCLVREIFNFERLYLQCKLFDKKRKAPSLRDTEFIESVVTG